MLLGLLPVMGRAKSQFSFVLDSIADSRSVAVRNHYNNSGYAKVEFDIPTESGYFIECGWYADSPLEKTSDINLLVTGLNEYFVGQVNKDGDPLINEISITATDDILDSSRFQGILDRVVGEQLEDPVTPTRQFSTITLGPFFPHADKAEVYITTNNWDTFTGVQRLAPDEAAPCL